MQSLRLELLGVTEKAALASYPWIGRGNKQEADRAATEAMRERLNAIPMDAVVVIGEGELDEAPMLYIGERLGLGFGPQLDIAVDPLEGTRVMSNGQPNAIAVLALAPKGTLLHAPDMYMEKIAAGPSAAGKIDLAAPIADNLRIVAESAGKRIADLTVAVQDRERHREHIEQVRRAGARIRLFDDGDVAYTVATAIESANIDLFVGIGGAPEGVISAVALKCLGGDMQARLLPGSEEEAKRCIGMGLADPRAILTMEQMVRSEDCCFTATGITDNLLLRGVRELESKDLVTHSLFVSGGRGGGGLRFVETVHRRQEIADHVF